MAETENTAKYKFYRRTLSVVFSLWPLHSVSSCTTICLQRLLCVLDMIVHSQ